MTGIAFLLAYLLDLVWGDPQRLPHPVRLLGKCISGLENFSRSVASSPWQLKIWGIIIAILMSSGTFLTVSLSLFLAEKVYWLAQFMLGVFFAYCSLATKDLYIETRKVFEALQKEDLLKARKELAQVVGRDTAHLEEAQIIRALIETIAENIGDGIIAPLFYLGLGGPAMAMTYKAINTLDSMLGYKNAKYRHLGWASAKLDDVVNFIPARLSGLIIVISCAILRKPWQESLRILLRDHQRHDSPNSGWPEAAMAGALGLQLGGINYYFGEAHQKPYLGDKKKNFQITDIREAWKILFLSSLLMFLFIFSGVYLLLGFPIWP